MAYRIIGGMHRYLCTFGNRCLSSTLSFYSCALMALEHNTLQDVYEIGSFVLLSKCFQHQGTEFPANVLRMSALRDKGRSPVLQGKMIYSSASHSTSTKNTDFCLMACLDFETRKLETEKQSLLSMHCCCVFFLNC